MKPIAALSSLFLLGTIGLLVNNLFFQEQNVHLTFSEEDIYADL